MREEIESVRRFQDAVISRNLFSPKGYQVAGCYESSQIRVIGGKPVVLAGGDYYDVISLDKSRTAFVVGDAAGHGMRACMSITIVQTLLQTLGEMRFRKTSDFVAEINRRFCDQKIVRRDGSLVTLLYGILRHDRHELQWTTAGHPIPILHDRLEATVEQVAESADTAGPPLGVDGDIKYGSFTTRIPPGGRLLLYSDGLVEASPDENSGRQFGINGVRRTLIRSTPMPADVEQAIKDAYDELCKRYGAEVDTAVRSSATAEDLPDASFAGQQDTYLNVRGHAPLLEACRACFASLFTDRAIAYRQEKEFDHFSVALSIAVQKMVRSDLASAGVMFSIDTESGFKDAAYITGGYGLGENVVQGSINPDEFYVHKPTLAKGFKPIIYAHLGEKQQKMIYRSAADGGGTYNVEVPPEEREKFCIDSEEVLTLARWAIQIEDHYSKEAGYYKPMDIEWAKDGESGELFIVQARPETVVSRREAGVIRRMV
ncbi:MAG: SpoIIE family protein phosphatase, partial [Planctomycetes bacterium]|nr:SpoIIE family protein phosphatase [Planctomycetota bacterium]